MTLSDALGADVDAPLEVDDARNLRRQGGEGRHNLGDLLAAGLRGKAKQHHMPKE
jgi:hypothetical protein